MPLTRPRKRWSAVISGGPLELLLLVKEPAAKREEITTDKLAAVLRAAFACLKEGWLILAEAHSIYGNEDGRPPKSPVIDKPANGNQDDKNKAGRDRKST